MRARVTIEWTNGKTEVLEDATVVMTYTVSDDGYGVTTPAEIVALQAVEVRTLERQEGAPQ